LGVCCWLETDIVFSSIFSVFQEQQLATTMADLSAENARPGSNAASALNSKDTSRAATPSNAPAEKAPEDGSKFKTLLGILRK